MTDVQDQPVDDVAPRRWIVGGIYAVLIGANVWLAWDWWRDTDQGRTLIAKAKAKAEACEGCAQRRARLRRATERMHLQARQIVEGEDVETQPEKP